jgi:major membrane immunogen (membrane-anchored lipoprotein)
MKKIFIIASLSLLIISGCSTTKNAQRYTIGMSEQEFKTHKFLLELVEQTAERSVYRRLDSYSQDQKTSDYMYYYFKDGKLVRIQRITEVPTIIVEHTK